MLTQTDSASREGRSKSGLRPLCPEPVECRSGEVSSRRTSQWCSQRRKMTGMSPMASFPFLVKAMARRKDKRGCVVLPFLNYHPGRLSGKRLIFPFLNYHPERLSGKRLFWCHFYSSPLFFMFLSLVSLFPVLWRSP